jgi:pimeloyl-ACP methyl ester carboxylesterase
MAQAGAHVAAAALGRGPAVVFLNDSTDDTCSWLPLAQALAGAVRTAAVFRYPATTAAGEADATRVALAVARKAGGGRFVLVGASLGGRIVFEAAASAPHGLAGIVSLSGERQIDAYRDILPDVRRVRVPVLYAGAREDSLTAGTRQPAQLRAALPSRDVRFVLVPGFAHGTELLDEARVRRAIDAFLARTLAG